MLPKMLDLDCHVIGDTGKLPVKLFDQRHGMADAIEEIRIAKGNVLCASGDLPARIFHHDVTGDDAECPFVNRNNRTMAAQMFAAAARFGGTHDAIATS